MGEGPARATTASGGWQAHSPGSVEEPEDRFLDSRGAPDGVPEEIDARLHQAWHEEAMTSSASPGREGRRRRRRPKRKTAPPTAASVLSEATAVVTSEPAQVPMTPGEVARMKATLRFLREHRHTLKLKVNAAEDLLLNGRREPVDRGLCQHLLSKLDRARVIAASERLPPAEATELLAGIVRFAPEIPYVVRFLQCVKASSDREQTAAALTQALERLELGETSTAQLRDLLLLIVEVFPRSELPVFVFTLLDRPEFRAALDRSMEGFPESLAQLLGPLRALHERIGRAGGPRRRRPEGVATLLAARDGAGLMLEAGRSNLGELEESVRRRLLDIGSDVHVTRRGGAPCEALVALLRGVPFRDAGARAAAGVKLAAALLGAREDRLARQVLAEFLEGAPVTEPARRWPELLDGARVGDVAVPRRRGRDAGEAGGTRGGVALDRWQRGWHVTTQREVLVRVSTDAQGLGAHAELLGRALLPGVARVVAQQLDPAADHPAFIAVDWHGRTLESSVRGETPPEVIVAWCVEACLLLHGLALAGLELPDAAPRRFSVDGSMRLWLTDLWGARHGGAGALGAHHALAQRLCRDLLEQAGVLARGESAPLDSASSTSELLAAVTAP